MKSIVKKILISAIVIVFAAVSVLPMFAFQVKRYYGDIDNDGKVTITDARNILLAAIDISESDLSEYDFSAADADRSGKIGVADARYALRVAAQLEKATYMPAYEFNKHPEDFTKLVNDYRAATNSEELKPLNLSPLLSDAADKAAEEFVTETGTALRRKDGTYYNTLVNEYISDYYDQNGLECTIVDKVMCVSTTSYAQAFNKMQQDVQSQKALLSKNYTDIGVGAYSKDGKTVYWCVFLIKTEKPY